MILARLMLFFYQIALTELRRRMQTAHKFQLAFFFGNQPFFEVGV